MQKLRPFLTALLGLTLWVQGLALAAAPVELPVDPGSSMGMPCHGDVSADIAACDCCDEGCPDMAGCVIGHFAGAPSSAPRFVAAPQAVATAAGWQPKTAVLPFPLRPPISSHA